jgi:ABC-type Fe3+ transport system substrate-binding protein
MGSALSRAALLLRAATRTSGTVQAQDRSPGEITVLAAAEAGRAVRTVAIPPPVNVTAAYPVRRLKESKNAELAEQYMALLLSDAAQTILKRFGFIGKEIPGTER